MKLADKVVVVTGAGSGMGRAMVKLFAAEGASVVAAELKESTLSAVVEDVKADGGNIAGIVVDVSKPEDAERMVNFAVETYGRLDILVNNAGIMDNFTPVAELTDELWDKVLGVNLTGPFRASRRAVQIMLEQGGGVIINTASVGGLYGTRAGAAYTASKHGIVGLTKNIAFMYADKGIRCNAICPGAVETNIMPQGVVPNALGMDKAMKGIAANPRSGDPMEIARVALFLASDDSSFVNGVTLVADGGWTAY